MLQTRPLSSALLGIGVGAPATTSDRPFASFNGPGGIFIAFVELHCILFGFLRIVTDLDPWLAPDSGVTAPLEKMGGFHTNTLTPCSCIRTTTQKLAHSYKFIKTLLISMVPIWRV